MNPFDKKYHQTQGTHCWFCEREFGEIPSKYAYKKPQKLVRTREHIIPKSKIIYNYPRNYIASCKTCNGLKGKLDAREFAMKIEELIKTHSPATHNMYKYFPLMRTRAWKLYNKTSNLHKNYKTLRNA